MSGYLQARQQAKGTLSPAAQPAAQPAPEPAPAPTPQAGYLDIRRQVVAPVGGYLSSVISNQFTEPDRLTDRPAFDPNTANLRYSSRDDMNERPRGIPDTRVADETWADNVRSGVYSIIGSAYEGMGSTLAGLIESGARAKDAIILGLTPDAEEQEYLRDIVRRETEFGYRSKLAGIIRSETKMSEDDVVPGFWTRDLPNAIGYTAAFLAGGAAGALARVPIWLTTATLGAGAGGLAGYEDAVAHLKADGVDPVTATDIAGSAYLINWAGGTSEAIPLFRVFERLDKYSGGQLSKTLGRKFKELKIEGTVKGDILKETAKSAIEEALQETFQEGLQNWTASEYGLGYDPGRSIGENLGSAAGTGGAVGGLLGALAAGLGLRMRGTTLEGELERIIREGKEQGLDVSDLQAALRLREESKTLSEDLMKLELEYLADLAKLTPEQKQIHEKQLRQTARLSDNNFALVEPTLVPLIVRTPDGKGITLRDFIFKRPDLTVVTPSANAANITPEEYDAIVSSAGRQAGPVASRQEATILLQEYLRDLTGFAEKLSQRFKKITGSPLKLILSGEGGASANRSGRDSLGYQGTIWMDRDGNVDRETDGGTLADRERRNPGTYNRAYYIYLNLADIKRGMVLSRRPGAGELDIGSVIVHEITHAYQSAYQNYVFLQAERDQANGKLNSPAIQERNLMRLLHKRALLQTLKSGDLGQGMYENTSHIVGGGVPGHFQARLNEEGEFLEPYYYSRHELFARLTQRVLAGEHGKRALEALGLPDIPASQALLRNLRELDSMLAENLGPEKYRKFNRTYATWLETRFGSNRLLDSLDNPIAIDFIQDLLAEKLPLANALEKFRGWGVELDKFNWFIKWSATLPQLGKLNPKNQELQEYLRLTKQWDAMRKTLEAAGIDTIGAIKQLGKAKGDQLIRLLLEETTDGKFNEPATVAQQLGDEGLRVYQQVHRHFRDILRQMKEVVIEHTREAFTDPAVQLRKVQEIEEHFQDMENKPYFPLMRFGNLAVEVRRREDGKLIHFELFESAGDQQEGLDAARGEYNSREYSISKRPVTPFELASQGLPYKFVEVLQEKFERLGIQLSEEQKRVMKELSYNFLPSRSFLKSFKQRKGIGGYSFDGMRIISAYTQNASGHIARAKWGTRMQKEIKRMRDFGEMVSLHAPAEIKDRSKRFEIANYLDEHYKYIMEPSNELATLRSLGFVWYLGFNIKSAFVNLTQVPFVTYPYLASRYGDLAAGRGILRAQAALVKYWKDPKSLSDEEVTLLQRGREEGWLDESLASTLAVIAENGTLDRMLPVDKNGRVRAKELGKLGKYLYHNLATYSALPFHAVEKFNRAVTAIASYQLAREKGGSVEESHYAAWDAVESTQFEYSRWARAKLFRGKKGAALLFQSYTQGMLYFLLNDPGKWRALGIIALVAGLQGLPGADDLLDMMDFMGRKWKEAMGLPNPHVDLRKEMRKEAAELVYELGINPDLFFRGIGSQSMGLGLLGEMLNAPIPNVDISGSLSLGNLVPGTESLKRVSLRGTPEEFVGRVAEDIAGPLGAMGMGLISPWIRRDPDKWRRFERALPLFARNASKAMRIYNRGEEAAAGGAVIAEFDPHDPQDLMELALLAVGFTPRKIAKGWERHMAELEVMSYWSARKATATLHYNYATETGDREGQADALAAIKRFNKSVPYPEMQITAADMRQSAKSYLSRRAKERASIALQRDFVRLRADYARAYGEIPPVDSPRTEQAPPALP